MAPDPEDPGDSFVVVKTIGSGAFGEVCLVQQPVTKKMYALKAPKKTDSVPHMKHNKQLIRAEAKIYDDIAKSTLSDGVRLDGIPITMIHKFKGVDCLLMNYFGSSLTKYAGKMSLKMVTKLTIRMIHVLQCIHKAGYVHRDVKCENMVFATEIPKGTLPNESDVSNVFLIDLGIGAKYGAQGKVKCFVGTSRYASITAHMCVSQMPKDDIESLLYVMIFMFQGNLPWSSDLRVKQEKDRYIKEKLIYSIKKSVLEEKLCERMPREYLVALKYVKNMDYSEAFPYDKMTLMFTKLYNTIE